MKTERKEEFLINSGWTIQEGWVMDYEKDPDHSNVLITTEDFERFKKEKPKRYYWIEDDEFLRDIDEAWECFLDNYADSNDLDLENDELEAYIEKQGVHIR